MKIKNLFFLLVLGSAILSGCVVSKKKYDSLSRAKSKLEVDMAECKESLAATQAKLDRAMQQIDSLQAVSKELKADTTQTGKLYRSLITDYNQLMKNANKDARKLSEQLTKAAKLKADLEKLEKDLEQERVENEKIAEELQEREKRVNELEKIIEQKERAVSNLKDRINKALLNFDDSDLSVEIRDGKIYVSLAEKLLFQSGSFNVDSKGKDALQKIASTLSGNHEFDIVVEGHTDDVPISKGATIKDNWDLSVLRATSIVRILTANGVDSQKVMACGRGEHMPVATNDTPEGRRKNRRTEIIISPRLDKLMDIINQDE